MIAPAPRPGTDTLHASSGRAYDIAEESVRLCGRTFSMLAVRDTNRLLESIDPSAFAVDERLPYWAEIWTSALALAEWCLRTPRLAGACVLELGCGLGLAGLAAAAAGARVTMTDYEDDALDFARRNAARNLPADTVRTRLEFRKMDWRTPVLDRRYEIILGADIVYERRMFPPLLALFERVLVPEGVVMLADPDRSVGREFLATAEQHGYRVTAGTSTIEHCGRTTAVVCAELRRGSPA